MLVMERGWKPNIELSPACPRCGSSNTKFCYYNNYSLTQPRYFCKACRRYWTKGGSLRNVPVGGGCRKSRRGRSIRAAADAAASSRTSLQTDPILEPTCSTSIDLAAVYANFLNQPPPPPENLVVTTLSELPDGILIPRVEFSALQMNQLSSYLGQDNGFFESGSFLGSGGNSSTSFGGLASAAGNDFEGMNMQPPLPWEEAAVSEGMIWPSSEILVQQQMLQLRREIRGEEVNFNGNLEAIFKC